MSDESKVTRGDQGAQAESAAAPGSAGEARPVMDHNRARYLWAQLCAETVGGNDEGPFERITALGNIATALGLPLYAHDKEEAAAIAAWLESWALALRGGAK